MGHSRFFWNRMRLCSFSVFLMWLTSLQTATFIASKSISIPSISIVNETCTSAIFTVNEEERNSKICVDIQLQKCQDDLEKAIQVESLRTQALSTMNDDLVLLTSKLADQFRRNVSSFQSILGRWSETHYLPTENATCSAKDREFISSSIYNLDNLKREALAHTSNYRDESMHVVQNIADYTKTRMNYDKNYATRYIGEFELTALQYMRRIRLPKSPAMPNLEELNSHIQGIIGCSTFVSTSSNMCIDLFPKFDISPWENHIASTLEKWEAVGDHYEKSYNDMIYKFHQFNATYTNYYFNFAGFWARLDFVWNMIETQPYHQRIWQTLMVYAPTLGKLVIPDDVYDAFKFAKQLFGGGAWSKYWPALYPIDLDKYFRNEWYEDFRKDFNALQEKWKEKYNVTYNEFKEGWEDALKDLQVAASHVESEIQDKVTELKRKVTIIPDDYNPPKYKIDSTCDEQIQSFENTSEIFLQEATDSIYSVTNTSDKIIPEDTPHLEFESTFSNGTDINARLQGFDIAFEELTKPGFKFQWWFIKFDNLSSVLFFLDFSFRIFLTIRMYYKYWDVSTITIPQVDIRTHQEMNNPFRMSNGRLIFLFFTNPIVGLFLATIVVAAITATAIGVYTPIYLDYRSGCRSQDIGSTFLGENAYSLSYNYAYRGGASSLIKGKEKYDVYRSNSCTSNNFETVSKFNRNSHQMEIQFASIEETDAYIDTFEKCLNIPQFDTDFWNKCIQGDDHRDCPFNSTDISQMQSNQPGELLKSSVRNSRDDPAWFLNDSIFDCSILPKCDSTCSGPHKGRIQRVTKECSCIVEWFIHALILRWLLTLFVFISTNVSRVMLINGLAKVFWKKFHPGTIVGRANCDEFGRIITHEDGSMKGDYSDRKNENVSDSVQKDIKKKMKKNSFIFQAKGYGTIFCSLLLTCVWVAIILIAPNEVHVDWL